MENIVAGVILGGIPAVLIVLTAILADLRAIRLMLEKQNRKQD